MNTFASLVGFALAYWFFDGLFAWVVVIAFIVWLASKEGTTNGS
jgi:type IV secretory pathway TrbD component